MTSPAIGPIEESALAANGVASAEVRSQLDRILSSRAFVQSHRIRRFLQFVVEESLLGKPERLKEYLIGVEVFDRRDAFDPRVDSIVRVEARRLRYKLDEYYRAEGRHDAVRIILRKGSYVPAFEHRTGNSDPALEAVAARRQSDRRESCEAYLEGRYLWKLATPDSIRNSVSLFASAVEGDPNYAAAWAALAEALLLSAVFGLIPPGEAGPRMKHAASQAVSLNPSLPEAQVAMGAVQSLLHWDWTNGEDALLRSIQLDHHDPVGHIAYGIQLACLGKFERAVAEVELALELDPASVYPNFVLGWVYGVCGRFDEAISQHLLVSRLATDSGLPHLGLGMAHAAQGRFAEAIVHLANASRMKCGSLLHGQMGYCYASSGRREEALQELGVLTRRLESHYVSPISFAAIHAGLNDHDQALSCLEQAVEARDTALPVQLLGAEFARLRDQPRFHALRKRMGLVQASAAQNGG
jgi:tetratricopeptide (TPR) repeat protein